MPLVPSTARLTHVQPLQVWDDTLDGAERRFPAHLDLIIDPKPGEWWADR